MKIGPWHQLDSGLRALLPFVLTVLFEMLGYLPFRSVEFAPVLPALGLTSVFYWSVFRPDLMPIWVIFLIGLFHDLVSGSPLGVGTFSFLMVGVLVGSQRRFFAVANFALLWVAFVLVVTLVFVLAWGLASLLAWQVYVFKPVLLGIVTSVATYPCLHWLLGRVQQLLLTTEEKRS